MPLFRYGITLGKNIAGKYIILREYLYSKKATSKSETMKKLYEVSSGEMVSLYKDANGEKFSAVVLNKTLNLLSAASLCALFYEKFLVAAFNNYKKSPQF